MNFTTTTTTTHTITDLDGLPEDGIEVPIRPSYLDCARVVDGTLYYAADDDYVMDYEWQEGVQFVDGSIDRLDADEMNDRLDAVDRDTHDVYPVGKYDHGLVSYSRHGERQYPDMQWDYGVCGFIAVPKDFTDTAAAADAILDEYTSWCNGAVYLLVEVPLDDPDAYEVCGGFIGPESIESEIAAYRSGPAPV